MFGRYAYWFRICLTIGLISFSTGGILCQHYSLKDTLRGSITKERAWWDLLYYHLDISVNPSDSSIEGSNLVRYKVLTPHNVLQIDLQEPLKIQSVTQDGQHLEFETKGSAHFIQLKSEASPGAIQELKVHYGGYPHVARRAPWEGGFSWKYDNNGNPFAATSCQGIGASIWWPCKDHMYDEVDSMLISVKVPKGLMNVSNGRLRKIHRGGEYITTHWFVSNPINNYGVNVNIGDYVHFSESYEGEKGDLDCDYYVLRQNLDKARKQFAEVRPMLEAFEYWFGPYPFYEDGFKIVETPYLGMEHQSSITYGNGYQNGYKGKDLSKTGWGMKFDFIIIHESGHEWFANSITYRDIADMWVHESFTAYSECLYLESIYGPEAGADYVIGTRSNIKNDIPIIGVYGVNQRGSGDMYYKGSNMLHMMRQIVNNDDIWRKTLRGLNSAFYHQTVRGSEIEEFISKTTDIDFAAVFDQYLRDTRIPILQYRIENKELSYRWSQTVDNFDMPVDVDVDGQSLRLFPQSEWKTLLVDKEINLLTIDKDFYVAGLNITG